MLSQKGEGGRGNERVHIIIALIYKFSIAMQFSEAGSINQNLKICLNSLKIPHKGYILHSLLDFCFSIMLD